MNLLWNSVANLLFIDTRHTAVKVVAVRRELSGNDVHKRRGARGNRDRRARALPLLWCAQIAAVRHEWFGSETRYS
jgi:hypothetical protein